MWLAGLLARVTAWHDRSGILMVSCQSLYCCSTSIFVALSKIVTYAVGTFTDKPARRMIVGSVETLRLLIGDAGYRRDP